MIFINLSHFHRTKQRAPSFTMLVFPVWTPALSFLCIIAAICKILTLLWSHIAVTAVYSGWQLSLLSPLFFHQGMHFLTLHQLLQMKLCEITVICCSNKCVRILCISESIYCRSRMSFICSPLVQTGAILWLAVDLTAQATHHYSGPSSSSVLLA